ncbi:hypothetical protein SEA_DRYAD_50 [Streptomyces phage Dryad]|nr:hypothetical protein SEA_DRYAD_50 [Streptomyces phage Dryad]
MSSRVQKIAMVAAGLVAVAVIGSAVGGGDDKPKESKPAPTVAAQPKAAAKASEPPPGQIAADQFRECIQRTGMVAEKTGGTHVTKVQGTDTGSGPILIAEVWTNYVGGMFGPDAAKGKVLASAFATCYKLDPGEGPGLVTVYDANGEILANGNY